MGQTQPVRSSCTWPIRRRVTLLARGESLAASMPDYLITQQKATQHRSPAPHPSCRRPRPSPPGSPDARGRPARPARTGPRRGRLRNDRCRAAHTMAPRPRQAERSRIHPDRPRRSPTEDKDWTMRLMPEAEITAAAGRAVVMGRNELQQAARRSRSMRGARGRFQSTAGTVHRSGHGPDAVDAPSGRRPGVRQRR